jgi:hypothetical protein
MANKGLSKEAKELKSKMRRAFANYRSSEGCGCCEGSKHEEHEQAIAKLLGVPKYKDGSGYDFSKYQEKEKVE